jgi:hypothetical protein
LSLRVLVIPEDPTNDQHVLKPICERLFQELGRPARIDVLHDPHLRGVTEALDAEVVRSIVDENPMIQLFLLLVDRDGRPDRPAGNTDRAATREREHAGKLLACLAIEEVEVWLLALHEDIDANWQDVRSEPDPKERFFDPFVTKKGWTGEVGGGRKKAMRVLAARWRRLLDRCSELADLEARLRSWLETREG